MKNIKYILITITIFIFSNSLLFSQSLILKDTTISGPVLFSAHSITIGPNFTISETGDLILAADSLEIKPEFFVINGGSFHLISGQITTALNNNELKTPDGFDISQNYPNPFNPGTTIKYALPHSAKVKIAVYNVLGQHIATLVDGIRPTGIHQINFDAIDLPSGMYFYGIQAGSYNKVMKMMLVK